MCNCWQEKKRSKRISAEQLGFHQRRQRSSQPRAPNRHGSWWWNCSEGSKPKIWPVPPQSESNLFSHHERSEGSAVEALQGTADSSSLLLLGMTTLLIG